MFILLLSMIEQMKYH